jgi:transposase-like protein
MAVYSLSVVELQSRWQKLTDLDRARAVYAIHCAGISLCALAKALNCSPSLLRHLLTALQASREDRSLAQQGKISTNELVRRAKAAEAQRVAEHNAEEARNGCRVICDWIGSERISGSYGESIVTEARRLLAVAESNSKLPKGAASPDIPVAEIIKRCKPKGPRPDNAEFSSWIARWLARWAFYSMPDSDVRLQAIDLALEYQCRRL